MIAKEVEHLVKRVDSGITEIVEMKLPTIGIRNNPTTNAAVDKVCSFTNARSGTFWVVVGANLDTRFDAFGTD